MAKDTVAAEEILRHIRIILGVKGAEEAEKKLTKMQKSVQGVSKGVKSATSVLKGFSRTLKSISGLLGSGFGLGYSIKVTDKYYKSLIKLSSQFSKWGMGSKKLEKRVISLSERMSLLRSETIKLMSALEKALPIASFSSAEKILEKIRNTVGSSAENMGKMSGIVTGILQKFPGMQKHAENLGKMDKERLRSLLDLMIVTGKINYANARGFADYIGQNEKMNKEHDERVKALQKMRAIFEDVAIIIGNEILPLVKDFANWIGEHKDTIKSIAEWLAKWGVYILGAVAALKVFGVALTAIRAGGAITGGIGGGIAGLAGKAGLGGIAAKAGGVIKGGLIGGGLIAGGAAAKYGAGELKEAGHRRAGGAVGLGGSAATVGGYAVTGATIGSIIPGVGTAVGAGIGAVAGIVSEAGNIIDSVKNLFTGDIIEQQKQADKIVKNHEEAMKKRRAEIEKEKIEAEKRAIEESKAAERTRIRMIQQYAKASSDASAAQISATEAYAQRLVEVGIGSAEELKIRKDITVNSTNQTKNEKAFLGLERKRNSLLKKRDVALKKIEKYDENTIVYQTFLKEIESTEKDILDINEKQVKLRTLSAEATGKTAAYSTALVSSTKAILQAEIELAKYRGTGPAGVGTAIEKTRQRITEAIAATEADIVEKQATFKTLNLPEDAGKRKALQDKINKALEKQASLQVELQKVGVEITKSYDLRSKMAGLDTSYQEQIVNLMNQFAMGTGASAMMIKEVVRLKREQLSIEYKRLATLDKEFKGREDELAYQEKRKEIELTIVGLVNQEAQAAKSLRDGWISSVKAMTIGSGRITKIAMTADKNLGLAVKNLGMLRTFMSGFVARPGEAGPARRGPERFRAGTSDLAEIENPLTTQPYRTDVPTPGVNVSMGMRRNLKNMMVLKGVRAASRRATSGSGITYGADSAAFPAYRAGRMRGGIAAGGKYAGTTPRGAGGTTIVIHVKGHTIPEVANEVATQLKAAMTRRTY